jgi:fructose-specific component phosphotransferase system IIB-like protein
VIGQEAAELVLVVDEVEALDGRLVGGDVVVIEVDAAGVWVLRRR